MDDNRIPKQLLFGELLQPHPSHGTKRRWRDLAAGDVQATGLGETWFEAAQDKSRWVNVCKECQTGDLEDRPCGLNPPTHAGTSHTCSCGRSFRRQGDLTRHSRFCNDPGQSAPPPHSRMFVWTLLQTSGGPHSTQPLLRRLTTPKPGPRL